MRELQKAMKLVPKSLYAEFGDKPSLFVAAIDRYIELNERRYAVLQIEPLGLQRIRSYYEALRGAPDRRGCLLVNSLGEAAAMPERAAARIRGFFSWLAALYQRNLEAAAASGALNKEVNVRQLAAALVVFDQGLAIAARSAEQSAGLAGNALCLLDCIGRSERA